MKTTVLMLALTLAPAAAHALDIPVKLRNGATWTQTSVHTRTDVRNGATTERTATSVIKATYRKDGATETLQQDFVSFEVEGVQGEELKALSEQARMIYPAVLEVDEALRPTRVRDWDRMRELIFEAVAASSAPDAQALENMRAMFTGMTDEQATTLFKEQGLISLGQGTGLEIGQAFAYDSEVPNIIGGPPIKASGVFRLESVDKAKGVAVVTWSQTPDPASMADSLKVSMEAMVARVAPEKQAEAKAQFAALTLERQEACRYEVRLATGLATTTDCTVAIKSGLKDQLAQRTDRWVITQSMPEPR